MSEHFGEASIFIRPDASKFRAELLAQLEKATAGLKVTVPVVAAGTAAKASTESKRLATAHKEAGVAAAQLSAQEAQLAQATALQTAAASKLAAVEDADVLTTSELAGAKAKLRVAEGALVVARRANVAAIQSENAELIANAAATLRAAEATAIEARAVAVEAVAHRKASGEIASHAAAHHALAKGAAATGLSLVGARGATLAASTAFLAGAAAITVVEKSVHEASREQEAAARVSKVFGDEIGTHLKHEAEGLAATFGLSARQALDFEGRLGNLFHNARFGAEESAHLSEELVKLAADMAAFANVPIEDTLNAINLGLVGNSRGLRKYQIELSQSRVTQEALRISGKKSVSDLTQEERIRARVNLLLRQTTNQQGAAAARAGDLAQEEKVLKAELENLGATIGRLLIPELTGAVREVNLLFAAIDKGKDVLGRFGLGLEDAKGHATLFGKILHFTGQVERDTLFPLLALKDGYDLLTGAFRDNHDEATKESATLSDTLLPALEVVEAQVRRLLVQSERLSFRAANNQLETLQERMTDAKIAGIGLTGQLANLEQQEGKARAAVAAATAETRTLPGSAAAEARRRAAKDQLLSILEEERNIRRELADQAQEVADSIAQIVAGAQAKVQEALDRADQAFLDTIGLRQGRSNLAIIAAEGTKALRDDIAAQRALQAELQNEIVEARKTISNALLRAQTIQDLSTALLQSRNSQRALEEQQRQDRIDARRRLVEERGASIDADIEFAQINKNTSAEIRAHEAKIKFINQRIAHTKRGTLEWKRLRNERAREIDAIKELRGQNDKLRADLKALQFEFLQTQSGFAANLLSNLLPTSAVAGTVGGAAISTPTGERSRPPDVGAGLGKASAVATGQKGASSGQMSSLIQIQRSMLTVLVRLAGGRSHPEAAAQAARQAADLDIFAW